LTQIVPEPQSLAVVQLPGMWLGGGSLGAAQYPSRQTQPGAQSALAWQLVAQPRLVQTWGAVHW
jgi:hypothetical protein